MDGEKYNEEEFGIYGFGNVRTLRDYEKYSGILFSDRSVQSYTQMKEYPPNPYNYESEDEWLDSFNTVFKYCIDLKRDLVVEPDYDFWVVAFHDKYDQTLYRKDATKQEINSYMNSNQDTLHIWREYNTNKKPHYWVVWPHSMSKGWCDRITGKL
jgi:hypothetical protein